MKIYYIDAENVGLNVLNDLTLSVLDRVFVFTNSEGLKTASNNAVLTCMSGYPSGSNQADFYIIAHLSNVLANLTKAEKNAIEFILCSKDQSLWKAFEFQCRLAEVKSSILHLKVEEKSVAASPSTSLEVKILKLMVQPITSIEIQKKLGVPQSEFTTSFNQLIKSGKIKRQEGAKKKWFQVNNS